MKTGNQKLMLVVGRMLFDENCVMLRVLGQRENVHALEDHEAASAASCGEIPAAWSRFGAIHHSLTTCQFKAWHTMKALAFHSTKQTWMPFESPGLVTNLGSYPFLCWATAEAPAPAAYAAGIAAA